MSDTLDLPRTNRKWDERMIVMIIMVEILRAFYACYAAIILSDSMSAVNGPFPETITHEDIAKLAVTWLGYMLTTIAVFLLLIVQFCLVLSRDFIKPRIYFICTTVLCTVTLTFSLVIFTLHIVLETSIKSLPQVPNFKRLYRLANSAPYYWLFELLFAILLCTSAYLVQRNVHYFYPPIKLPMDDKDFAIVYDRNRDALKQQQQHHSQRPRDKVEDTENEQRFAITDERTDAEAEMAGRVAIMLTEESTDKAETV